MELRLVFLTILLTYGHTCWAQYEDDRCKCICPSPQIVSPNATSTPTTTAAPSSNTGSIISSTVKPNDAKMSPNTNNNNNNINNNNDKPPRSVYIANTPPSHCNCEWVVLQRIPIDAQLKAKEFCPLCECKYESRNISTIRWVVTLCIGIICCLIVYMGFLMLLDPLINKSSSRARRPLYEQQIDDDQINHQSST